MDYQIENEIKNCFWRGTVKDACDAVETHLGDIDFDDEDDIEKLIGLVVSALKEKDGISFLEYIISKGFDVNFKLLKKECLVLKCAEGYIEPEAFKELERFSVDMYSESSDGDNILLRCVERDERLALFITENYDLQRLDHSNRFGLTPLMYAAMNNKPELAKALIAKGSDANAQSPGPVGNNSYWIKTNGLTPLALAVRCGSTEIVKLLIDSGADIRACDDDGCPAVFSLVYYPFRFLEEHHFNSPLFDSKREIIPLLKDALEVPDKRGYTVLMEAMCSNRFGGNRTDAYTNVPIAEALIENGANVNAVSNDGTTALHLAVRGPEADVKALIKAKADPNARDNSGNTPLILACKWESEKTVRMLLRAGADFNIKNNAGESAADLCAARGFQDALEMMI
ncbi:MAG: ankyrin repeat domain-containing protein [Oscillospiraceae bacterium]|nr:ankyrin repeat domain-containing protein [Oscillospiraceae bacterium]